LMSTLKSYIKSSSLLMLPSSMATAGDNITFVLPVSTNLRMSHLSSSQCWVQWMVTVR
jgi:hypothetical protein